MVEREPQSNKIIEHSETRFVSDGERARRFPSNYIRSDEVIDYGGNFNALDGTHPHTQEAADAADREYLAQHPLIKRQRSPIVRAARAVKRALGIHLR